MNPSVFRAVMGRRLVLTPSDADGVESFYARDAVLQGYKKISPDNTYLYAVPDPQGRIRGYLIGPLPGPCLTGLRKYEGHNYTRKTVRVQVKEGLELAVVCIGNLKRMEHSFGYPFGDPFKQEILLRQKIEAALLEAEREQLHTDESVARRALGELHGSTIRDLARRHFEAGGISDYAIRRSIKASRLRDYSRIKTDPQAQRLAANYLEMVIRQVLFNQLEEKIRQDFRYELDQMDLDKRYYERSISSLAALRILNSTPHLLDLLCGDCFTDVPIDFQKNHLLDFIRWAVVAADAVYDRDGAQREVLFIKAHSASGCIPLGAELEFSNIGHEVIRDPQAHVFHDARYDGFLYFNDFALDVLTWKLGGHIDDHHEKASTAARRGFFETALGSLSLEPNLSKPITDDPWTLNQMIQQTMKFYNIVPHSLHISMQLRSQHRPGQNRLLPLYAMKCLLAIAGDPFRNDSGQLCLRRLSAEEIVKVEPAPNMLFCEISKRHSSDSGDDLAARSPGGSGRFVQQYKFLRLSPQLNYEVIAVALKGLQMDLRPGSFLTPSQYKTSRKHRELFDAIMQWSRQLTTISEGEITAFLGHIYDGLINERRGKPAHSEAYIGWAMDELRKMITQFNSMVQAGRAVGRAT